MTTITVSGSLRQQERNRICMLSFKLKTRLCAIAAAWPRARRSGGAVEHWRWRHSCPNPSRSCSVLNMCACLNWKEVVRTKAKGCADSGAVSQQIFGNSTRFKTNQIEEPQLLLEPQFRHLFLVAIPADVTYVVFLMISWLAGNETTLNVRASNKPSASLRRVTCPSLSLQGCKINLLFIVKL